jgi:POT family proton-dependent oligopeptide transporter
MSDSATPAYDTREWLGHPRGLFYLFFAEMWERFCFYGMRGILTLYMAKHFLYEDAKASTTYGTYNALVYLVAIFGGLIADRIIGYRKAILLGGILMAIGEFVLLVQQETWFFAGMAFLVVGNSFFKPNISTIVGRLYGPNDPRRDSGFSLFYVGINIGALVGGLVCGYVGERFGWTYGFAIAGAGMLLGLVTFHSGRRTLLGKGEAPSEERCKRDMPKVIGGALLAVPAFYFLLKQSAIVNWALLGTWAFVLIAMLGAAVKEGKEQRERIYALLALFLFNIAFWAGFEQAGSSLTLFADRNTDLSIGSWSMPASWAQQFNPLFIILFGALFARMWTRLAKSGLDPSIPLKFALALLQLSLAFGILVVGARFFATDGLTPLAFLVLLYLFQTTGELFLSPIGLSMVTKLAPERMTGMVMGAWFLSIATAHKVAGWAAGLTGEAGGEVGETLTPAESLPIYTDVYQQGAIAIGIIGVILLVATPLIRKWMHGVK